MPIHAHALLRSFLPQGLAPAPSHGGLPPSLLAPTTPAPAAAAVAMMATGAAGADLHASFAMVASGGAQVGQLARPTMDPTMLAMFFCMLGVPLLIGLVAYLLIGFNAQRKVQDPREPELQRRPPAPANPRLPSAFGTPSHSVRQVPTREWLPEPRMARVLSATRMPYGIGSMLPRWPGSRVPLTSLLDPSSTAGPSSMRLLLPTPGATPRGTFGEVRGYPPTAEPASSVLSVADLHVSPLSTALLVKHPAGVLVRLDGELTPHPERRTINVVSVKDSLVLLCAHVAESSESGGILVETKADRIPVAMIDTCRATVPRGGQPRLLEQRRVVFHRVSSDGDASPGPPCAVIVPAGVGKFLVQYTAVDVEVVLTVIMIGKGSTIDRILDPKGNTVARSELTGYPGGGSPQAALWVKQGVDMALMACVAISVQKLI